VQEKLNLRFLFLLAAAVVLFCAGWYGVHAYQVRRTADTLLAQAEKAEQRQKLDRAVQFLDRYLILHPENTDARRHYAALLEKMAELAKSPQILQQALSVYENVLTREPERSDIRRHLAMIQFQSDRFAQALANFKILQTTFPDDGEIEYWLGRCHESTGNYAEAVKSYESSIKHAPSRVDTYLHLAGVFRLRQGRPEKASHVMDELVRKNKDSAKAYLERALYHKGLNQNSEFEKDISEALKRAPQDVNVLVAAGEGQQLQRNFKQAREYFQRALANHPKNERVYQALAELEIQSGQTREAVACLNRGLAKVDDAAARQNLLWSLALLDIDRGALEEARPVLAELREKNLPQARLDFLDAYVRIKQGKWLEASRLLERGRPLLAATPELANLADLLLGKCYNQLGEADRETAAYRRALASDPASIPASAGLVSALWNIGRIEDALSECDKMMSLPAAPATGWLTLAQLLIAHNLRLAASEREWNRFESVVAQVEKALPDSPEPALLRAEVAVAEGKLEEAKTLLEKAKQRHPKNSRPRIALANLAKNQNKPEQALAVLAEADKELGFDADVTLARLAILLERGGAEATKALAQGAADLERAKGADRVRLLRALADGYHRLGNLQEARRLLHLIAQLELENRYVRLSAFDLAMQANDEAGMEHELEALKAVDMAAGPLTNYAEARRLLWRARRGETGLLTQAREHLANVAQQKPNWAQVPLCRAQIHELAGTPDLALPDYLQAIELGEKNIAVVHRAVELLFERQRYIEAGRLFQQVAEQSVLPQGLQRLGAELSLREGDYARALQLARKAVSLGSKNYRDHLWLGQILSAGGDQAEAEASLRRAVDLANKAPEVWVALVQFLARAGKQAEANKALAGAQQALPREQSALAIAQCYEAVGKIEQAKESYRLALDSHPEDLSALQVSASFYLRVGLQADAARVLKKIIALKSKSPAEADRARRTLGVVLAASGNYSQQVEAFALLGILPNGTLPAAATSAPPEEQRARALALAAQPGRQSRQQAIGILERLSQSQPLKTSEQFVLAQLYESVGEWPRSHEKMRAVLALNGSDPVYIVTFIRSLLRHRDYAEAQRWLDALQRLPGEMHAFRTAEIRARLQAAQGPAEQAIAGLRAFLGNETATPGEPAERLEPAGLLLDDLAENYPAEKSYQAAAEEVFRQMVAKSQRPEMNLALALHFARHGRQSEALQLCNAAWQTCPAEVVGNATLAVLHLGQADESQFSRVEQSLTAAIQKNPSSVALQICMADLKDLEGRFEEAATLYRRILQQDGRNFLALNNLAWLLAQEKGTAAEALELIQRAIEIAGPQPELLDTKAVALLAAGQTEQSISTLEDLVVNPTLDMRLGSSLHFHLASAYHSVGKTKEADREMDLAKRSGLRPARVHPLEQKVYKLLTEVNKTN
jgi:tetratricopeptide (TPR) repeat protein